LLAPLAPRTDSSVCQVSGVVRASLPGHARWLLPGFGYIGQSIIIRFCLTTCHCVHANCHAHWLNTLGPSQRGQRMGSCFVESYVFSLVGTCTFEQDSFSPIFWRASPLGCARKDIKKYSVYRSTITARASLTSVGPPAIYTSKAKRAKTAVSRMTALLAAFLMPWIACPRPCQEHADCGG
jgi:hypothetical protein